MDQRTNGTMDQQTDGRTKPLIEDFLLLYLSISAYQTCLFKIYQEKNNSGDDVTISYYLKKGKGVTKHWWNCVFLLFQENASNIPSSFLRRCMSPDLDLRILYSINVPPRAANFAAWISKETGEKGIEKLNICLQTNVWVIMEWKRYYIVYIYRLSNELWLRCL